MKHALAWFGLALPWILILIFGYGHETCFGGDEEYGPSSCYYFVDIIMMTSLIVGILYFLWVYREQYRIFHKYASTVKDWFTPNWWAAEAAQKISDKTGLQEKAENSRVRKWLDKRESSLTGWKWLLFQVVRAVVAIGLIELVFNLIGMTILPWRM